MNLLTPEVIEGFVGSVLSKGFDQAVKSPKCHKEWWAICCGDAELVAIAAPRYHAKSTAITHSYTLAELLFRSSDFCLIISDTEGQSKEFLGDIKKELQTNEDLIGFFGVNPKLLKDSETDIIVEFTDGKQFRIIAKGAEQKVRGLKWNGKRPNLIIVDDLENDEMVLSKDRRDKLRRWFFGALLPCRAVGSKVRYVGTILHQDALLERLMPEYQLGASKRALLLDNDLKQYTEQKLLWTSVKYRAHNSDFSKILWKEMWPEARLKEKRQDYILQGLPDVYSQEYLNIPLDESNAFFRKSDFHKRTEEDRKKKLLFYIGADLAISQKQRADYSAFVVAGMDEDGKLHIVNVIRERTDDHMDIIFGLQNVFKPEIFGIEDGAIAKSIGTHLNTEMISRNKYITLRTFHPHQDKMTRARSIQARMRAGGIKFDKEADWYQAFEDELLRFPRDKHDDQVDAFAIIGMLLDKMTPANTAEEQEREDFEREYAETAESQRCQTTGY